MLRCQVEEKKYFGQTKSKWLLGFSLYHQLHLDFHLYNTDRGLEITAQTYGNVYWNKTAATSLSLFCLITLTLFRMAEVSEPHCGLLCLCSWLSEAPSWRCLWASNRGQFSCPLSVNVQKAKPWPNHWFGPSSTYPWEYIKLQSQVTPYCLSAAAEWARQPPTWSVS